MTYIKDTGNVIEIGEIINQIFKQVEIKNLSVENLEVVIPCLYHRNDKSFFDVDHESVIKNDVFKHVRNLDFPYETKVGKCNIIIHDGFYSFDKEKESKEAYLDSFDTISYSTNNEKIIIKVWYRAAR